MEWSREYTQDGTLMCVADASDGSPQDMQQSCKSAWELVAQEVLPLHQHLAWDVIRLEVWADSGRTILLPAPSPLTSRVDVALAMLYWPLLQNAWNEYEEGPDEDEAAGEEKLQRIISHILDAFEATYSDVFTQDAPVVECYKYETKVRQFGGAGRSDGGVRQGKPG